MPLTEVERAYLYNANRPLVQSPHQRLELAPSTKQKIGKFTVICLVLNRTIGSGIFSTPHRILGGTGCVGAFFLTWLAGSAISFCGLCVWLECSLSMPQKLVEGEDAPRGVPRSGGEKNWLETMFPNPQFRTTCCYAIMFILVYNLSGNAIAFGIQVMIASGLYSPDPSTSPNRGTAVGIAIAALSVPILIHIFSRRGGILINNGFAVVKTVLLILIFCLGVVKAAGRLNNANGDDAEALDNFTKGVWNTNRRDVSSYSTSLVLCMYSFSGWEQPFYVLAETKSPHRSFPKAVFLAMTITIVLFMMVNVAYLLVVPKSAVIPESGLPGQADLATLFFRHVFNDQVAAARATAGLIAISIFGNIVVMTFTASRVKQEIAKEGILPWSLVIATSRSTPFGLYRRWMARTRNQDRSVSAEEVEQSPMAAFALHWSSSILLIVVTLPIRDPRTSYYILVSLYSYVIIVVLGSWVSIGLLWTKLGKSHLDWKTRRRYRPWFSPVHAVTYALACVFMLVAAFVPPSLGSPYHESVTHVKWYIVPAIGLSAPLWGMAWYLGLLYYQRKTNRTLRVTRTAYIVPEDKCEHEYLQVGEVIDHSWPPRFSTGQSVGFRLQDLKYVRHIVAWMDSHLRPTSRQEELQYDKREVIHSTKIRLRDRDHSHPLANNSWRQFAFVREE